MDLFTPSELIVVRHGEAAGNARGIVQGREPFALTATGREQARVVGQFIARIGWAPARIVTSPVVRARETAAIVGSGIGISDATPVEAFAEIDPGRAVGQPIADFSAAAGMEAHGGESVDSLYRRVADGLDALPRDEPLLIVTHGCVFKAVLAHLLDWRGDYWLDLRCGTCMRLMRIGSELHSFTHLIHPEEMRLD